MKGFILVLQEFEVCGAYEDEMREQEGRRHGGQAFVRCVVRCEAGKLQELELSALLDLQPRQRMAPPAPPGGKQRSRIRTAFSTWPTDPRVGR